MSNPPKQDWGSVAHEINVREHDRTKSEAKTERDKLLGIISEQSRQLEVALSLDGAKSGATMKLKSSPKEEAVAFAIASDFHVEES